MLNGAIWAPLVLMFLLRAVRGERPVLSAALAGFFLGLSWLSGHHQIPIFVTLAMAGVWVFYLFREGKVNWNVLALAGVFAVFLALTSALQVLPANEYGRWRVAGWVHPSRLDGRKLFRTQFIKNMASVFSRCLAWLCPVFTKRLTRILGS